MHLMATSEPFSDSIFFDGLLITSGGSQLASKAGSSELIKVSLLQMHWKSGI
jgi:hypothetical protein